MLKIKCDGTQTQIIHGSNPLETAIELSICIDNIYSTLKAENQGAAEVFQKAMQTLIGNDDSPAWNLNNDRTVVRMPAMKKGDAPTDQS